MDNIGLLFDEGTKRVLKTVGISGTNPLGAHVAPELQLFANLATKGVMSFSNSVEYLLRRYNKDIIHEQFLLQRLANAAIDIFVMMTVLSRASRSVNKNLPSAQLEVHLASVICSEVSIQPSSSIHSCILHPLSRPSLCVMPLLLFFPPCTLSLCSRVSCVFIRALCNQFFSPLFHRPLIELKITSATCDLHHLSKM